MSSDDAPCVRNLRHFWPSSSKNQSDNKFFIPNGKQCQFSTFFDELQIFLEILAE